ncbi:MAG: dockerin type I domain-containing protein [Acutalibacteraceae bacterium]|nr:dockerin type I domain-containing protein [Acutalibacteraceae bacterium]
MLFETKNMAADINQDGVVNILDLIRLKKSLVENEPRPLKGDINQDGLIDFADVDYLTDYLDGKFVNVELVYADVTCDGIINEDDLFALLEMVE